MKIQGAIFDLDGTLLDSMFIWNTIGETYLLSRGITPEPGLNDTFKAMSLVQAAEYYRANYHLTDSVASIMEGVNHMIDHLYTDIVTLKPGVLQLIETLRTDGVKLCVATATDRYMVESALQRNGILQYFSHILTCTEVGFGKDSPVIFEQALERLGTDKSQTLVFEDALHAIETAKRAGFTVVGIYDASAEKQQDSIRALSDIYFSSFQDWRKLYD